MLKLPLLLLRPTQGVVLVDIQSQLIILCVDLLCFFFDDFYQAINWKLVWPCQHCPHRIVKEGTCWRNVDWKSLQVYFSLSRSQTPQSLSLTTNPNYYAYCLIHQTQIVASASLFVSCRAAKKIYIAQQIGVSSANDFDAASVWQGVYTF